MKHTVIRAIESAINGILRLDPDALNQLTHLLGKVIAIDIQGVDTQLYLYPFTHGIHLTTTCDSKPDTTLRCTPNAFLRMAYSTRKRAVVPTQDISIEGDIHVAKALQSLIQRFDIDWEEHIAHVVGDIAAHRIGRTARGAKNRLRHIKTSLGKATTEYIQEEARLQPSPAELDAFYREITALRDAVERAEASIHLSDIEKKIT